MDQGYTQSGVIESVWVNEERYELIGTYILERDRKLELETNRLVGRWWDHIRTRATENTQSQPEKTSGYRASNRSTYTLEPSENQS